VRAYLRALQRRRFHDASQTQVSAHEANQFFKHLKTLELEMEGKQDEFSALGETCSELCKYNEADDSFKQVQDCIIELAEQWDALVQKMEELGESLSKNEHFQSATENGSNKERITVIKTNVVTTETVQREVDDMNEGIPDVNILVDVSEKAVKHSLMMTANDFSEKTVNEALEMAAKDLEHIFNGGETGIKLDWSLEDESLPEDIIVSGTSSLEPYEQSRPQTPTGDRGETPIAVSDTDTAPYICYDSPEVHELSTWVDKLSSEVASLLPCTANKTV
jgi:hypothetical protein